MNWIKFAKHPAVFMPTAAAVGVVAVLLAFKVIDAQVEAQKNPAPTATDVARQATQARDMEVDRALKVASAMSSGLAECSNASDVSRTVHTLNSMTADDPRIAEARLLAPHVERCRVTLIDKEVSAFIKKRAENREIYGRSVESAIRNAGHYLFIEFGGEHSRTMIVELPGANDSKCQAFLNDGGVLINAVAAGFSRIEIRDKKRFNKIWDNLGDTDTKQIEDWLQAQNLKQAVIL